MQTPYFEYSRSRLQTTIDELSALSLPYGLVIRYAMKANPHPIIIEIIDSAGFSFDASSEFEAQKLIEQGINPRKISLSSQQSSRLLQDLVSAGVQYVAVSERQLMDFLTLDKRPDEVAIRINPGMGSGGNMRTSTGGISSSFGIWHEYIPNTIDTVQQHGAKIHRVHIHVGSGGDPKKWAETMDIALDVMRQIPNASILDIGGGFKVSRYSNEIEADMPGIMHVFSEKLKEFAKETGRELQIEIEPGTYMVAHAGTLVATVDDLVDTGRDGYRFIKLNTGMNDFLRSSMYGAQHKIEVINSSTETGKYLVVGHNCESGDILTPAKGDPEGLEPRTLNVPQIGDEVRIFDTGAYCSSMRAHGYNSFPDAEEVFID